MIASTKSDGNALLAQCSISRVYGLGLAQALDLLLIAAPPVAQIAEEISTNRKVGDLLAVIALCFILAWCIPSAGQVLNGSICGIVVDPQGAVVPDAQVKATHGSMANMLTARKANAGLFRFNLIPTGNYKVEVTAQVFETAVNGDIGVAAGRESNLGSIQLSVGETSTTVEVNTAAPLIDTAQAQVINTFSGMRLQTFAGGIQDNQGVDTLALFAPGVSLSRKIDAQNNNDNSVGGPSLFASNPKMARQYVLIANQFDPEYGRNAGSVVNIITKSGTYFGGI